MLFFRLEYILIFNFARIYFTWTEHLCQTQIRVQMLQRLVFSWKLTCFWFKINYHMSIFISECWGSNTNNWGVVMSLCNIGFTFLSWWLDINKIKSHTLTLDCSFHLASYLLWYLSNVASILHFISNTRVDTQPYGKVMKSLSGVSIFNYIPHLSLSAYWWRGKKV